jgi:hypothetical protein
MYNNIWGPSECEGQASKALWNPNKSAFSCSHGVALTSAVPFPLPFRLQWLLLVTVWTTSPTAGSGSSRTHVSRCF